MTPNVVTIRDVATAAGVSVATVSRVLNGNDTVDPRLAERVRAAADQINYRPNTVARSLRTQSSNSIALVISDVTNPFFTAVARGAEDAAQERGYSLLLCNVDENPERERQYVDIARQSLISGLVISPHDRSTDLSTLRGSGVPIVVIDRHLATPSDGVFVDSYAGAVEATEHLFDGGWKRPACITGPRSAETACLRADGYREAVGKVGGHAPVVEYANFKEDGGEEAARRLLGFEQPPDAFLVANAPMALGALSAIRERGLQVGRDIGIATFDDAPWAPHVSPAMTVVAQPAYEIGSRAVALLFEGMGKGAAREPREVVLPTDLIVRESSRREGAAAPAKGKS